MLVIKMKIIETKVTQSFNIKKVYQDCSNTQVLFFDIETTGFSPKTSEVYLIGCLVFQNNHWNLIQFFSESPEDERKILIAFQQLCNLYDVYIHFNGESFDVPYIRKKFKQYQLDGFSSTVRHIDLFKKIKSYHPFLQLENYRLSTLMDFIGVKREDFFSGGELIKQYYDYRKYQSSLLEKNILSHNKEDVLGLPYLLSLLQHIQLLKNTLKEKDFSVQEVIQKDNQLKGQIVLQSPSHINLSMRQSWGRVLFSKADPTIHIEIKLFYGTLYYFFDNYKDYYYLPEQDEAIHKSVGRFASLSKKEQAKASNCYSKKKGYFMPIWKPIHHYAMFFSSYKSYKKNQGYIPIYEEDMNQLLFMWFQQYLEFILY